MLNMEVDETYRISLAEGDTKIEGVIECFESDEDFSVVLSVNLMVQGTIILMRSVEFVSNWKRSI